MILYLLEEDNVVKGHAVIGADSDVHCMCHHNAAEPRRLQERQRPLGGLALKHSKRKHIGLLQGSHEYSDRITDEP